MITIALCDDDSDFLMNLEKKIYKFFKIYKTDVYIKTYSNGKELLSSNDNFRFIFLDIDMPEISGTEAARIIRKHNDMNVHIIFVTNHDHLVYQSFEYQPLRFLRKSHIDVELDDALKAIIKISNAESKTIVFNTSNGNVEKKLNEIIYLDVLDHDVTAHTKDSDIHVYGTLSNFCQITKSDGFIRIHKSYLVNIKYINAINHREIILDNQITLPLSRHKHSEVKKAFHEYIREK